MTRGFLLWAAFASYAVADDAAVRKELQRFTGTWDFSHLETPNRSDPVQAAWKGTSLSFDGEKVTFRQGNRLHDVRIRLRSLGDPATMGLLSGWPVLYRFEGKSLRLSYLLHGSVPERFEDGIVVVFVRRSGKLNNPGCRHQTVSPELPL